ncbi:MAG: UDP-2,3-diacylglucosamine diphosphatase [Betaproteobacteria bacterium]|nr:UDP-2,3-diacylglucosamine diphosphatase [Betaproteobacteria bacterium]
MPSTLLISDLHLSSGRPETSETLFRFLAGQAQAAGVLYILGDLFEAWVGDDELQAADGDPLARETAAAIRALADAGTAVHLMHGNRDFLLRDGFLAAAGATLLTDPTVVEIGGVRSLLMHGDTLCTDDTDYQSWRQTARSTKWQDEFLAKPLAARRTAMRELRDASTRSIRTKPAAIMDVNANAVADAFRRHGVQRMIHGHTHRPARHEHIVDGTSCERWVLPDWYDNGGYLVADNLGLRMVRF